MRKNTYLIRIDKNRNWMKEYREVSREELDELIKKVGHDILNICSRGDEGAMAMWACFANRIKNGRYGEMINAYRLLAKDNKSLVEREHELRHAWYKYDELWKIRYYGTVEHYYLKKSQEAKETMEKYLKREE